MENVYRHAVELLQKGKSFVYASIISQDGSTPRGSGSKMLVLPGEIRATIGGGLMEAKVIEKAREVLKNGSGVQCMEFDLSGEEAAFADFICGGNCEILLLHIPANNPVYLQLFQGADKLYRNGEAGWLITIYDPQANTANLVLSVEGKGLIGEFDEKRINQALLLSPSTLALHNDETSCQYIVEPVQTGGVVYLFGAGHVSTAVAKLTNMLEFETIVIDDRTEYLTPERFPNCRLVAVENMEELPQLPVDQNSYILIITRGHVHDETVLRWAVKQDAGYIGMIGSSQKRDTIYGHLEAEGVTSQRLQAVYSPIGLPIGGQTPAEIAISIAAELVQVRNENKNRRHKKAEKLC